MKDQIKKKSFLSINRIFLLYTLVFCAYTVGIFAVLIISHRSFMQFHDAYKQGAFRLIELKNQLDSIIEGNGFSYWSWYEGMGLDEPLENFVDPASIVGSLFPIRYLELGFTIAALIRMYLGGLAFIVMGKEVGLKEGQNLIAATLYTFSSCCVEIALRQSEMLINITLFPLLVASVDRIYKGKSPFLFIITVAYYMIADLYFSYMSAIVIIIYILTRYFAYNDKCNFREYISSLGRFILYGSTGIMLSAFASVFSAMTIMRASTDSSNGKQMILFDTDFYLGLGKMLLGTGATYDYSDIGPHILAIILLPIAIRNINRKSTGTIMMLMLFAMLLSPFFCSMFNGFGYVTFRWVYMLLLFSVWSAIEQLDANILKKTSNIHLSILGLIIISIWTIGLYGVGAIGLFTGGKVFIPAQIVSGIVLVLLFLYIKRIGLINKRMYAALLIIPLISLSIGWAAGIKKGIDNFARNSSVYNKLNESTLRVGNNIEDEGFYRIDSVDGISRHADLKFPSNENIWWKTNNLFLYNSSIPQRMTDYSVDMGNSYGYARRVFTLSNGERMGMDFLSGVRYFLGSDSKKEGYEDSDYYVGYGFEEQGEIDGVKIFKNKYETGLGFAYDCVISEDEIKHLNGAEKELIMMQAAVVADEQLNKCRNIQTLKANEVDSGVEELSYAVQSVDGVEFFDGGFKAKKGGSSFIINIPKVKDCQLLISFDNLLLNSQNGEDGASYEIRADNGKVKRTVINQKSRQGVNGLRNHSMNMGCYKNAENVQVKISFSAKGRYTFDRMYVSSQSTSVYDESAKKLMSRRIEVTNYNDHIVEATVNTDKDGVLFFSVPAYDNWDIFVDGEKATVIEDLNECFFGTIISKGNHQIQLRYSNKYIKYGTAISAIGLIIMIIILLRNRRCKGVEGVTSSSYIKPS